jgi:hypothetical protein
MIKIISIKSSMLNQFVMKIKKIVYPLYAFKELLFKIRLNKKALPILNNPGFKIPLVVYQSWNSNVFPNTIGNELKKFRNLNPDIEFNLYNHSEVNDYMRNFYKHHLIYKIFKKARYWQIKADIFRYCIIYERGGFWFDIKSVTKVQLSKMLKKNSDMMITYEKNKFPTIVKKKNFNKLLHANKYIAQWFFGSVKKNFILKKIINNICDHYDDYKGKIFENPKEAVLEFSATRLFTKILRNELIKKKISLKIQQQGVDFNGQGSYMARGGLMLNYRKSHYSFDKFRRIIN